MNGWTQYVLERKDQGLWSLEKTSLKLDWKNFNFVFLVQGHNTAQVLFFFCLFLSGHWPATGVAAVVAVVGSEVGARRRNVDTAAELRLVRLGLGQREHAVHRRVRGRRGVRYHARRCHALVVVPALLPARRHFRLVSWGRTDEDFFFFFELGQEIWGTTFDKFWSKFVSTTFNQLKRVEQTLPLKAFKIQGNLENHFLKIQDKCYI